MPTAVICVKGAPKVNCASSAPRIAANALRIMGLNGPRWSRRNRKNRKFSVLRASAGASFAHDDAGALAHIRPYVDAVPPLGHRGIGPLKDIASIDRR